tara:strand:- start:35091 stop:35294 length:204 start_codon:yes stop_codon:yes gene_type:complete
MLLKKIYNKNDHKGIVIKEIIVEKVTRNIEVFSPLSWASEINKTEIAVGHAACKINAFIKFCGVFNK